MQKPCRECPRGEFPAAEGAGGAADGGGYGGAGGDHLPASAARGSEVEFGGDGGGEEGPDGGADEPVRKGTALGRGHGSAGEAMGDAVRDVEGHSGEFVSGGSGRGLDAVQEALGDPGGDGPGDGPRNAALPMSRHEPPMMAVVLAAIPAPVTAPTPMAPHADMVAAVPQPVAAPYVTTMATTATAVTMTAL